MDASAHRIGVAMRRNGDDTFINAGREASIYDMCSISPLKSCGCPLCLPLATITFIFLHFIVENSICRKPEITHLWSFRTVKKFKRVLWAVLIAGFAFGVTANIYAIWVQRNIEAAKSVPQAQELQRSKPVPPTLEKE